MVKSPPPSVDKEREIKIRNFHFHDNPILLIIKILLHSFIISRRNRDVQDNETEQIIFNRPTVRLGHPRQDVRFRCTYRSLKESLGPGN